MKKLSCLTFRYFLCYQLCTSRHELGGSEAELACGERRGAESAPPL